MKQLFDTSHMLGTFVDSVGAALPGILAGLMLLAVFFVMAVSSRKLLQRVATRAEAHRRPLLALGGETLFYTVITIGLITGLGTMGINVSALIAGLGLTGFALGFALRDAVSNLIAGVLILLYQPFAYGDKITVAGNSGTVVAVNFRYTVLTSETVTIVHVPNSTMFNNSVVVERGSSDAKS